MQPISVYDVADFFTLALANPGSVGRTIELGGPEALEYREIVARVMQTLGLKKPTLSVPLGLMRIPVILLDTLLPSLTPITRDQFLMLQEDNICDMTPALELFPISLRKFADGIREYL